MTTACCEYKGLGDDCYELQTLRNLRDEYISKQPYGEELIKNYYKEAPEIVIKIKKSKDKDTLLENIYQKIMDIIASIESGKKDEAIIKYMMLLHLLSKTII